MNKKLYYHVHNFCVTTELCNEGDYYNSIVVLYNNLHSLGRQSNTFLNDFFLIRQI